MLAAFGVEVLKFSRLLKYCKGRNRFETDTSGKNEKSKTWKLQIETRPPITAIAPKVNNVRNNYSTAAGVLWRVHRKSGQHKMQKRPEQNEGHLDNWRKVRGCSSSWLRDDRCIHCLILGVAGLGSSCLSDLTTSKTNWKKKLEGRTKLQNLLLLNPNTKPWTLKTWNLKPKPWTLNPKP